MLFGYLKTVLTFSNHVLFVSMNIMYLCPCIIVYMRTEENQLVTTGWFIELIICSNRFGHLYANHQELKTIPVLLPHMVCNALVAGSRRSGAGQQAMRLG